jgi:hypothetical protein
VHPLLAVAVAVATGRRAVARALHVVLLARTDPVAALAAIGQAGGRVLPPFADPVAARGDAVLRARSCRKLLAPAEAIAAIAAVHRAALVVLEVLADTVAAGDAVRILVVEAGVDALPGLAVVAQRAEVAVVAGLTIVARRMGAEAAHA